MTAGLPWTAPSAARGDGVRALGLSLGVHLGAVLAVAATVGRVLPRAADVVERPTRLVFVEPMPAAAPPLGAPGGTSAGVPAAKTVAPKITAPARPRPDQRPAMPRKPRPRPAPATVKPEALPPAAPVEPAFAARTSDAAAALHAEIARGVADGVVGGSGDVRAGTADGGPGGRVGGRGDGVLSLGEVAVPPVVVQRVLPDYPRRARRAGLEGEVLLEVVVGRDGRVAERVRVIDAAPLFEEAAIAAVRRWRFRPARDGRGTAVAVVMEVPLRFVLQEGVDR